MELNQTVLLEVKCDNCKEYFSAAMLSNDSSKTDKLTYVGELVECPTCSSSVILTNDNMNIDS